MKVDGFQVASCLVFLANRVVEVEVHNLGDAGLLRLTNHPGDLLGAQGRPHIVGLPGADAQTVGHIGRIGGVDKLALQSG
jgi:hypothetical protein